VGTTAFLEPEKGEPLFHVRWLRHGWAEQVKYQPEHEVVELVKQLTADPAIKRVTVIPTQEWECE
jgi:hypothetical protein